MSSPLSQLLQQDDFISRHIGPDEQELQTMLNALGVDSIAQLIEQTVPASIRRSQAMALPEAVSETQALDQLKSIAQLNKPMTQYIGMGYHGTVTPNVILRNVLENPGWYTAYTPYQPEIAQGRLEALLNYQQMVMDLTGMDLANASLLDESTAAAEAMALCKRMARKNRSNVFFIDHQVHPQTLAVLQTRAEPMGIEIAVGNAADAFQADAPF